MVKMNTLDEKLDNPWESPKATDLDCTEIVKESTFFDVLNFVGKTSTIMGAATLGVFGSFLFYHFFKNGDLPVIHDFTSDYSLFPVGLGLIGYGYIIKFLGEQGEKYYEKFQFNKMMKNGR